MKVTYIFHSSFLVETAGHYLLFDYFKGQLPGMNREKPLIVFASHRHEDHFLPVIFDLAKDHPNTVFVLSNDIWQKRVPAGLLAQTHFMGPEESKEVEGLKIRTYRSTDEGVAFLVWDGESCIYHAGDLNNWTWLGEEDSWNRQMAENYHKELGKMAGTRIHAAFIPLDPRLESAFYLGVDDFMKQVGADIVFPMHFWEDYTVAERLKSLPCAADYKDRIVEIKEQGQCFEIEK